MLNKILLLLIAFFCIPTVHAEDNIITLIESIGTSESPPLAQPLQYLLVISALSFIPAFVIAATSFTRIIVVLSMLRLALGLQSSPPNSVLIILALFLTLFSMGPVMERLDAEVFAPTFKNEINLQQAADKGSEIFTSYMLPRVGEKEIGVMSSVANDKDEPSLLALTPAFMLTELKIAFQMGVLVFLPFVLIDLLVASTLMGLGMIMVPPMTIALPIKLIVFVLCDGWLLVSQSLMSSVA